MTDEPRIIADQAGLDALCRRWRAAGSFAFDTEFIRDETFDAALCLVQVACQGEVVLVDPTGDLDINGFWQLVSDPSLTKIVHAGKEDFDVCLRATGNPPRNVFDVQIAAGFVGYGYPLSLSRIVQAILHKRIAKGQTLTDWLRRPLTRDQLAYAVEDVAYLSAMSEHLGSQLDERERRAWAEEEFRRYEDPNTYRPPIEDRVFRLKGSKTLDGLGLATLGRLVEWRESWAREKNRPTRAMMRDDVLVEIARRRPTRAEQLEVLRGFPQSRNPRIIREILHVIEEARKIPRREWPQVHEMREETPMMRATLDILSAFLRATCHEEALDHDLVGGAARLRELLDFMRGMVKERPALLCGWREQFIGKRLVDLLRGRSELHLSGWPDALHLEVVTHGTPRNRAASG